MTVAVHLSPRDARIFKKHAARSGMSLSDFAVLSMRERMEDELVRGIYGESLDYPFARSGGVPKAFVRLKKP